MPGSQLPGGGKKRGYGFLTLRKGSIIMYLSCVLRERFFPHASVHNTFLRRRIDE